MRGLCIHELTVAVIAGTDLPNFKPTNNPALQGQGEGHETPYLAEEPGAVYDFWKRKVLFLSAVAPGQVDTHEHPLPLHIWAALYRL